MKKLRKLQDEPMGCFVTGEYGDKTQRPHWHAIIFNYWPKDSTLRRTNDRGDKIYASETLSKIWGKGLTEVGNVTFHSAGYVARYAAKKLVHGKDQEHDFHPISKKSNKHAIGKKWLETYWQDVFNHGRIVLPDGTSTGIPRYYEKWLKEHKPNEWLRYVTRVKLDLISNAEAKTNKENLAFAEMLSKRDLLAPWPLTLNERKAEILKSKFELLQKGLKL